MTRATDLIAAERERQITDEGFEPEGDLGYSVDLANAAECYVWAFVGQYGTHAVDFAEVLASPPVWPWEHDYWKPTGDAVRDLTKAGALIAASIDALLADLDETPVL